MSLALALIASSTILADEYSQIGDGSLYYCYGFENGDAGLKGQLFNSKTEKQVLFTSGIAQLNKQTKKSKTKLKKGKTTLAKNKKSKLKQKIASLKLTNKEIETCRFEGTTGRPDTSHDSTNGTNACAILGDSESASTNIVGGAQCEIGNSPVVLLYLLDENDAVVSYCSGTVVSKPDENSSKYVIFAAHCAHSATRIKVVVGSNMIEADSFYKDPSWPQPSYNGANDVAIAIFPSDLSKRSVKVFDGTPVNGEEAIIAGYGRDENGISDPTRLKAATIEILDAVAWAITILYDDHNASPCFGDSGGPFMLKRNGLWSLAGVTSSISSVNCAAGDYSYFTYLRDASVKSFLNGVVPGLVP